MPSWRKLIQSGSDAELASLFIFKSGSTNDRLLVVSGSNGEMMAVSDDNSGTLLRVNDVSGINMFSVSSSGHLVAPQLTFDDDAPFTLGYESGSGLVTYRSASNALSASYATTASYALNAQQIPAGTVSSSAQVVSNLLNQDLDLGTGDLTATDATVENFTINNTLTAPTITGSLLRLSENGTGLRLTNVGAFESSSGFHIFSNDNMRFSTNGSGGGNQALNLDKTSKKATFAGDIITTALTASGLNYPTTDGSADQVLSTDGNGNLSFNDISALSVPSFLVYGQEGTLTGQTTAFQMKTTNGAQATGWRMPVGGSVTHITLQLEVKSGESAGRNITAELYKNNTATGKTLTVACSSNGITGGSGTITTETFNAGDRLTIYITHNNASLATGDHAGLLRILTSTS